MNILLIEPYYTGSHKQWAEGYQKHSMHNVKILSLKGQFWKWRMHGGAVTLAREFMNMNWKPDLILSSDMLDLTTFISLTKNLTHNIPISIYFHENQLSYPWSPKDRDFKNKRNHHYGFINYASALAADKIFFNSKFHMDSFLNELLPFLKNFPDHNELETVYKIRSKSKVLYLGMDLGKFDGYNIKKEKHPIILWNHRWEYDKNPELFFFVLEKIKKKGYQFKLAILGETFSQSPKIFEKAKNTFINEIMHWGYIKSFKSYAEILLKADIIPVTSKQDFFGVSIMEAIYCNNWPILPKRLSYPELLPKNNFKDNFYKTKNELEKKIIWAINNYNTLNNKNFKSIAKKFDWSNMVRIYDETLGE